MDQTIQFCNEQIKELKTKQEKHAQLTRQYASLDNKLKQRKKDGGVLSKDDADVQELMQLGKLIGYGNSSQAETWNTYEAAIRAYKKVLKQI